MKTKDNLVNMPGWQGQRFSGSTPEILQEFIESEENEENNFYCPAGDWNKETVENRKEFLASNSFLFLINQKNTLVIKPYKI
ncbi:MAG: hypothetical protein WCJ95_22700 [Mariniphaga sp.]